MHSPLVLVWWPATFVVLVYYVLVAAPPLVRLIFAHRGKTPPKRTQSILEMKIVTDAAAHDYSKGATRR